MNSSLPGSAAHEISQATVLEQGYISFSRDSSQPRDRTHICTAGSLYHWATWAVSYFLHSLKNVLSLIPYLTHIFRDTSNSWALFCRILWITTPCPHLPPSQTLKFLLRCLLLLAHVLAVTQNVVSISCLLSFSFSGFILFLKKSLTCHFNRIWWRAGWRGGGLFKDKHMFRRFSEIWIFEKYSRWLIAYQEWHHCCSGVTVENWDRFLFFSLAECNT